MAIVSDIAREHGNVTLLRSDHSGSPSMPRNIGFEHGTGDYVFFLDADDRLDPRALEGLVDAAESNGSDIVLGRLDGMNGRGVPSSMFSETVLDADLVEQNLFFALGPTKLFRRSLIEQHGLRFPTDIRVGQDQPFVAEALLLARRVSVLADRSYYYARFAEDRTRHLSQTFETATQIVHRTRRVTDIVVRHTEPGSGARCCCAVRWVSICRVPSASRSPRSIATSRERAVSSAAALLREHGDPLTLGSLDVRKRIVLALVQAGATTALLDLHEQRAAGDSRDLVVRGGDWFVQIPRSVVEAIGDDACRSPRPTTVVPH